MPLFFHHVFVCNCRKVYFLCSGCKYAAKTVKGMIKHREKHPVCHTSDMKRSSRKRDYTKFNLDKSNAEAQCDRCNRLYLNLKSLYLHKASCKSINTNKKKRLQKRQAYTCNICHRRFLLEAACARHVKMHYDNPHLLRGGGIKKLNPTSWGYSENTVIINSSTFDDSAIMEILLSEFRNEITRRKKEQKGYFQNFLHIFVS